MRAGIEDRGGDPHGHRAAGKPEKRSNNGKITRKTAVFQGKKGSYLKKSYSIRKMDKILRELDAARHSLAYLTSIQGTSALPLRKEEIVKKRIRYLSRTIEAIEHSIGFLDPVEQKIITGLYFDAEPSIERVCETCALEKSSVYRYRARALEKLAAALFGE